MPCVLIPLRLRSQRGGAGPVVLGIVGGLILVCVLAVVFGFWVAARFFRVDIEDGEGGKRVHISTPFGEIDIRKAEDVAESLKLPVYPGAEADDDAASVRLRGWLDDDEAGGLDVTAAEFRSDDSLEVVDDWYRRQLGSDYVRKVGHVEGVLGDLDDDDLEGWSVHVEPGGEDVYYELNRAGRLRGVVLRRKGDGVKIGLFEVWEARPQ